MTEIETVSTERLAETHKRLQEILDYFDEEANEALANETERGDLWSDIEIPVADLRTLLALSRRSLDAADVVELKRVDGELSGYCYAEGPGDLRIRTNDNALLNKIIDALASHTRNTEVVVKAAICAYPNCTCSPHSFCFPEDEVKRAYDAASATLQGTSAEIAVGELNRLVRAVLATIAVETQERYAILNHLGEQWTSATFASEADAVQHLAETRVDVSGFKIVPRNVIRRDADVAVKDLNWFPGDGRTASEEYLTAPSIAGTYWVIEGQWGIQGDIAAGSGEDWFETDQEAKAAAQSDFDQRIRSALDCKGTGRAALSEGEP